MGKADSYRQYMHNHRVYYHGYAYFCCCCCFFLLKCLRMVALHRGYQRHASLCLGRRPCTSRRRVQGRSQGTTLSASDLHNAQATILNPFYNMEYKIIKKMRQNTMWIEAAILGINLTPNRFNALDPAIVYVNNDIAIPFKSVTSQ